MDSKPILSICIATYNRANYLLELVNSILELKRDDIEVAVTDNASTDDTVELLKKIKDNRLKVYVNEKNIGGANNTLMAVYNARGKYAFYCNDRDLIEIDKIDKVISILKSGDFSAVITQRIAKKNIDKLICYEKGVDSFISHGYTHHPTGLIFNRDIIESNINRQKLLDIDRWYALDFLLRELFLYEKSAIYAEGIWRERGRGFLATNRSAFQSENKDLYFYPSIRIEQYLNANRHMMILVSEHFSEEDKEKCVFACASYFVANMITYKNCMQSKSETQHYGIKRKYISIFSLLRSLSEFNNCVEEQIVNNCNNYNSPIKWKKIYKTLKKQVIIRCIKTDINFLLGRIK